MATGFIKMVTIFGGGAHVSKVISITHVGIINSTNTYTSSESSRKFNKLNPRPTVGLDLHIAKVISTNIHNINSTNTCRVSYIK